jgi:hypothetical protein
LFGAATDRRRPLIVRPIAVCDGNAAPIECQLSDE